MPGLLSELIYLIESLVPSKNPARLIFSRVIENYSVFRGPVLDDVAVAVDLVVVLVAVACPPDRLLGLFFVKTVARLFWTT
jgi:hypothetical protein